MLRRNVVSLSLIAVFATIFSTQANADQFVTHVKGREVVVHDSPLPVIFHRLIPPNYGRHMTVREYREGRLPEIGPLGRITSSL